MASLCAFNVLLEASLAFQVCLAVATVPLAFTVTWQILQLAFCVLLVPTAVALLALQSASTALLAHMATLLGCQLAFNVALAASLLHWAAQSAPTAQLATMPIPQAGARVYNAPWAATQPSLVLLAVSFVQLVSIPLPWAAQSAATAQLATTPIPQAAAHVCNVLQANTLLSQVLPSVCCALQVNIPLP